MTVADAKGHVDRLVGDLASDLRKALEEIEDAHRFLDTQAVPTASEIAIEHEHDLTKRLIWDAVSSGEDVEHTTGIILAATSREEALREALDTIAKGRPENVTPTEWGEWCTLWANDELNAAALASTPPPSPEPTHEHLPLGTVAVLMDVAYERIRQIEQEGWTPEHDNKHTTGDLADAAAAYALTPQGRFNHGDPPPWWPWGRTWWKPGQRVRELVKAGALIVAEIERLQRVAPPSSSREDDR